MSDDTVVRLGTQFTVQYLVHREVLKFPDNTPEGDVFVFQMPTEINSRRMIAFESLYTIFGYGADLFGAVEIDDDLVDQHAQDLAQVSAEGRKFLEAFAEEHFLGPQ